MIAHIKASEITKQELSFIEGRAWETAAETRRAFYDQSFHAIPFRLGAITLDLYDEVGDIVDTITISKEHFKELTKQ